VTWHLSLFDRDGERHELKVCILWRWLIQRCNRASRRLSGDEVASIRPCRIQAQIPETLQDIGGRGVLLRGVLRHAPKRQSRPLPGSSGTCIGDALEPLSCDPERHNPAALLHQMCHTCNLHGWGTRHGKADPGETRGCLLLQATRLLAHTCAHGLSTSTCVRQVWNCAMWNFMRVKWLGNSRAGYTV
jgi:hypothetical protein